MSRTVNTIFDSAMTPSTKGRIVVVLVFEMLSAATIYLEPDCSKKRGLIKRTQKSTLSC